jgi:hypothetical protein
MRRLEPAVTLVQRLRERDPQDGFLDEVLPGDGARAVVMKPDL